LPPPVPIYGEQAKKGPENPIYVVSAQYTHIEAEAHKAAAEAVARLVEAASS
jgi:hypothetical protein